MATPELLGPVLLGVAVGCFLLAIPLALLAYRFSPGRRRRAKGIHKHYGKSSPSTLTTVWLWTKMITIATVHATLVAIFTAVAAGLAVAFAGIPFAFCLLIASCIGLLLGGAVFVSDIQENSANLKRTGNVECPKRLLPEGILGSAHSSSVSPPFDDLLPSGYRRSKYHAYGATDEDIEFWGLDQPGAPPPEAAGWAVMELMEEMEADDEWL